MKKELFGTTALISAGLLAGSGVGQSALAADPLSLSVGGFASASFEIRDEDDSLGQPGANLQTTGVYYDGEIQFTASTTLDNGIGVRARIEYEAFGQGGSDAGTEPGSAASPAGTIADEHWIEFSGVFGQFRIGADDDAAYGMQYQAPVGAYQIGVNTTTFAVPSVGGNALSSYPTTYISATGDAEKVIWFSPRISGFQLGLSYAPDDSRTEASPETGFFCCIAHLDNEVGANEDVISIGLNFVETFNDIDVAVAGGYNRGDLEASAAGLDDLEQWSAGLNVGFAGFTVGASLAITNNSANAADQTTWDAGITYSTGPFTVGFTYLQDQVEQATGDDELDSFNVSGTYNLGPGVDVWGGLKYYQYEDDANAASAENEGYIVAVGTSVSF